MTRSTGVGETLRPVSTFPVSPPSVGGPLPSLTTIRAAAAMLVVLYHLRKWDVVMIPGVGAGQVGVGFFFVLSGFVLAWTARPRDTAGAFYRRRIARVYPNHLVTFAVAVLLMATVWQEAIDGWSALANLLLIQSWSTSGDVVFGFNGVAWSLSCEAFFYLAFPFLYRGLRRCGETSRIAVAAVALAVPPVIAYVWPVSSAYLFHSPIARLPEFVLGVVAAMSFVAGRRPRVPVWGLVATLVAGLLVADSLQVNEIFARQVLVVPFVGLLLVLAGGDAAGRRDWFSSAPLVAAGAASYALYLVHELVIRVAVAADLRGPVVATVAVVVSCALAWAMYRLVEEPARRAVLGVRRDRALTGVPGPQ